jgi:hypothetical protein
MIEKCLLAASAYSPIPMLTGVRVEEPALSIALILFGIVMAAGLPVVLRYGRTRSSPEPLRVLKVTDRGNDVASYLPTFLLPFLVVASPSPRDLIALALFGALLIFVSAQTGLSALNPWLYVKRLRLVQATVDRGEGQVENVLIVCKQPPVPAVGSADGSYVVKVIGSRLYMSDER